MGGGQYENANEQPIVCWEGSREREVYHSSFTYYPQCYDTELVENGQSILQKAQLLDIFLLFASRQKGQRGTFTQYNVNGQSD